MCGVVGIAYGRHNPRLGREAAFLLKKLEYRGYDSTGAAVMDDGGGVTLRKKVGAPSLVIRELDIEKLCGRRFIGQVRWATFGAVTDDNAQPHQVGCHTRLVGAHNGNIANSDTLKEFLLENGHAVVSDNDGEMLVHTIEHFYADELRRLRTPSPARRREALLAAIRQAHRRMSGSYAACVTAPELDGVFAVKAGSSLYAGKGADENGDFVVVSSDLTSVLAKTRFLVPLAEGQVIWFRHDGYEVFDLGGGAGRVPELKRSKLNIADITLQPKYNYFMEQEIYAAPAALEAVRRYYFATAVEERGFSVFERHERPCKEIVYDLLKLYGIFDPAALRLAWDRIVGSEAFRAIAAGYRDACGGADTGRGFSSDEAQLFHELLDQDPSRLADLQMLDQVIIWKKKRRVIGFRRRAGELLGATRGSGGRVFFIGAGTSYHAALTAGVFFNNLSDVSVVPCNPGMFRSLFLNGLRPQDVLLLITQSGETKDLVDIVNDVRARHGAAAPAVLSLVNNENSTIPQEKSDFFLPTLCGPEIAVAATKSFVNQLAVFYLLAAGLEHDEEWVARQLERIRALVEVTLRRCQEDVTEVMVKLFLRPSLHVLGTSLVGLAREGALKIREVVLNHAEGYDAAEFKHGPNTILGKNTIYSIADMERLLGDMARFAGETAADPHARRLLEWVRDTRFSPAEPGPGEEGAGALYRHFRERLSVENYFSNYPLLFVCPPDERDRRITVSQVHTHKIRGADVVLIAEADEDLRKAVEGRPAGAREYYSKYIAVPASGDANLFAFQAALLLQLLALRMSVAKMKYLNRLHVENHGVHPDVPKNVSKSITVD